MISISFFIQYHKFTFTLSLSSSSTANIFRGKHETIYCMSYTWSLIVVLYLFHRRRWNRLSRVSVHTYQANSPTHARLSLSSTEIRLSSFYWKNLMRTQFVQSSACVRRAPWATHTWKPWPATPSQSLNLSIPFPFNQLYKVLFSTLHTSDTTVKPWNTDLLQIEKLFMLEGIQFYWFT